MRGEPSVDAGRVERVTARGKHAERVACLELRQTHRALRRTGAGFRSDVGDDGARGEHERVDSAAARGVGKRRVGLRGAEANVDGAGGGDDEGEDEDNE